MATVGAPRRFCRCACFCTENLYVARYGLHVRFRGEQQLRRDYGPILRSRGCVSAKDFQQLLAEWPQEDGRPHLVTALCHRSLSRRWSGGGGWGRSQRLGKPSSRVLTARHGLRSTTHCRYQPARVLEGRYWKEEVASRAGGAACPTAGVFCPQDAALAPEFLAVAEYSVSPGADLKGLLQRLETVSEEKRIYRVPVFTAPFCQALLEELEHFEQSDMPKGRPNTMNNYGVLLHELGLDEPLMTPLRERFLQPLMALLYPDCGGGQLDSHRAFVVKYAPGQDLELGCHYDNAELTLNVALGKVFTGGALYFGGLFQAPAALTEPLEVEHVVGQGVLHRGGQLHGARPLGTGERWNLVVWLRASAVRNRLCPMCCHEPDLVDDEGFGDGFTREEPTTVDVCVLT
ncbi:2-oxoglutarate and iron-dependent oxygenase domain-containing protein 2 isoform X1 [Hylobates moloch]|uniref:2-oxoglutarate and iron-dependent oxygenase domain-containing protein 2 isoform X1 n=2 Tax=Hylobates moloch TaxID=81572 RepID=UPI001362C25B|nr:2-oxoglutarate and iron-dependent oxygenase domain-containing protein 2 isoform X1 [Hylobates moloch]